MGIQAKKRLEAIQMMEELGSGFYLAMHDLEIRGAGEVLGESQSGQIQEVGFDLYTRMLERAVRALKDGKAIDLDQRAGGRDRDQAARAGAAAGDLLRRRARAPDALQAPRQLRARRRSSTPCTRSSSTASACCPSRPRCCSNRTACACSPRRSASRASTRRTKRCSCSSQKDAPVDRGKVIALVQKRKNLRLAGPDRLRLEAKMAEWPLRVQAAKDLLGGAGGVNALMLHWLLAFLLLLAHGAAARAARELRPPDARASARWTAATTSRPSTPCRPLAADGTIEAQYVARHASWKPRRRRCATWRRRYDWYLRAAEAGHAGAQNNLGAMLLRRPRRTAQLRSRRRKLVPARRRPGPRGGADQPRPDVRHGHRRAAGHGRDGEAAAEGGARRASRARRRNSAACTWTARACAQDAAEAVKWFRNAAAQDNEGAQFLLAVLLQRGIGAPRDFEAAIAWYRRAANQRQPPGDAGTGQGL